MERHFHGCGVDLRRFHGPVRYRPTTREMFDPCLSICEKARQTRFCTR